MTKKSEGSEGLASTAYELLHCSIIISQSKMRKRKDFTDNWFFSDVSYLHKVMQIFVRGDNIIIAPCLLVLLLLFFSNKTLAIITFLVFITLRQLGEMIYWLLQQFGNTGYRPYDFGFKELSNKAIYVIYQLGSLVLASLSISLLIYFLIYLHK